MVGAGFAGLAAARTLGDHGHRVRVFDKGRGPAGRASVRRADGFQFDHGAQYFTARDPSFRRLVRSWTEGGLVAPWEGRFAALRGGRAEALEGSTERFVGVPGMNAPARHLAADLDVQTGSRVSALERADGRWILRLEEGAEEGPFDRVVVALPAAQAAELLQVAPALQAVCRGVELRPCWAVLLGLEQPYDVSFDGAFVDDSPLSWVARDSSKPGREGGEAWVLHAAPGWSAEHLGREPDEVIEVLEHELEARAGVPLPGGLHRDAHRWRYALADPPLEDGALCDHELGLAVAGDWCNGSRVEGAYLSGVAAAGRLLGALAGEAGPTPAAVSQPGLFDTP